MGEGTVLLRRRSLGDVVLLGAVTSVAPGPVTVVTEARYVALARRLRGVSRVLAWGEGRPEGRVIDLQRDLASLQAFPRATRLRKHSLRRRLRLAGIGSGRPPVTELYARAVGVRPQPGPWLDLPAGRRDALALLPGASSVFKAPRLDLLVRLGLRWDGPVVVLAGPGEGALVDALTDSLPGAVGVAEPGFDATVAALARSRVAVGGDTGLVHLAVACGVPAVVLAGPTHPDDGFLVGPGYSVLGRSLPCRPCALHRLSGCRRGDLACRDHDEDAAWSALMEAACAGSS